MYGVAWFRRSREISPKSNHLNLDPYADPYADYYDDIENSSARKSLHLVPGPIEKNAAPWATNHVRRGVDLPFSRQPTSNSSNRSSPTVTASTLPSYPNKSAKFENGSRFIEKFRESTLLARTESSEHFASKYQAHQNSLPPLVLDVDAPIPLPRLSEWVRADALRGISVHTNPHTGH